MADIEGGGGHKKGGKPRGKKMSTRVDFTPMVDLGFLLITFFMLTTSMSKPKTMEINMPVKPDKPPTEEEQTKFPKDRAVTLILGPKGNIFYYEGLPDNLSFQTTNFGKDGIRKYLLQRNKAIHDKCTSLRKEFQEGKINEEEYKKGIKEAKSDKTGPLILIKPSDQSIYKNMIDILDEMQICDIGVFAVVELNDIEKQAVEAASPTQP